MRPQAVDNTVFWLVVSLLNSGKTACKFNIFAVLVDILQLQWDGDIKCAVFSQFAWSTYVPALYENSICRFIFYSLLAVWWCSAVSSSSFCSLLNAPLIMIKTAFHIKKNTITPKSKRLEPKFTYRSCVCMTRWKKNSVTNFTIFETGWGQILSCKGNFLKVFQG